MVKGYFKFIEEGVDEVSKKTIGPVIFGNDDVYGYWIEENIPEEYGKEDLEKAFDMLSRADVFRGRIMRRQYYRFMVYQIAFLTASIKPIQICI